MKKANPTIKTQEKVLNTLRIIASPMSLSRLAKEGNVSIYQVKASITFLQKLGIVRTLISNGNTTLVFLDNYEFKKGEKQNGQ